MGKGDKKTKKGKIAIGSYGVRRPKKTNKVNLEAPPKKAAKKTAKKKK
ncbi:MAG: 30S ribosomal protein THX [Cyclobacteriaceae bacterium]